MLINGIVMDNNVNENYIVSSLVRGLKILTTFTVDKPALKVTEIAEITGFDQATVFRFVYTLEKLGYLVRDEETKRYHQSIRMRTLSLPASHGIAAREAALPVMTDLSKQVNQHVKLAMLDGVEIIILAFIEIGDKLFYHTPIGQRIPAYCSALGKILLAYQHPETLNLLISKIDFIPRTGRTITSPEQFKIELDTASKQGYSIQDEELINGLGTIAAPIFDHQNHIAAAISMSGIATEILHGPSTDHYIKQLVKSAELISLKLEGIH